MGFWTAVVTIVAIIAIATVISSVFQGKGAKSNAASKAQADAVHKEVIALKERVEALEKIVTDSSFDLKRQFQSLD